MTQKIGRESIKENKHLQFESERLSAGGHPQLTENGVENIYL